MKKLLIRGADVGYTEAFDLGFYKAVEEGVVTDAEVMLDSPHTVEALKWLKERPWITVTWHRHLWESPVLSPEEVPSLVNEKGRFKWGHNLHHLKKEATYQDAYKELTAELERCREVYGSYPEAAGFRDDGTELERAMADVCRERNIDTSFWNTHTQIEPIGRKAGVSSRPIAEKQAAYDLALFKDYDPVQKILQVTWDEDFKWTGGHPGFLDDHILAESTCTIHRIRELQMMIDPRLFSYIIENKIELVNIRDIRDGTNEYQDHLKEINSPLWVGNFH